MLVVGMQPQLTQLRAGTGSVGSIAQSDGMDRRVPRRAVVAHELVAPAVDDVRAGQKSLAIVKGLRIVVLDIRQVHTRPVLLRDATRDALPSVAIQKGSPVCFDEDDLLGGVEARGIRRSGRTRKAYCSNDMTPVWRKGAALETRVSRSATSAVRVDLSCAGSRKIVLDHRW